MQCVILAAGKGTRLRPETYKNPKPLLKIDGEKTIVDFTIEQLPQEISEIIFVVKYQAEKIREHYGEKVNGKIVNYVTQDKLDGTAGALWCCREILDEEFMLLHGDDLYSRKDLEKLIPHSMAMLVVLRQGIPTGGDVKVDESGNLKTIADYPATNHKEYLLNTGAYKLNKGLFNYQPVLVKEGSKEYGLPQTLAIMAKDTKIAVEKADKYFQINTLADLDKAREMIQKKEL